MSMVQSRRPEVLRGPQPHRHVPTLHWGGKAQTVIAVAVLVLVGLFVLSFIAGRLTP